MPTYLVESYLANSPSAFEGSRESARSIADGGVGIRYLRTTFLPGDETILHVYEAPSLTALRQAALLARLPHERIVEAVEGPGEVEASRAGREPTPARGPITS